MTIGKRKLEFRFSILVVYVAAALAAAQTTATPCRTLLQTGAPQNEKGAAQLENTYWKLVELNGKPVVATMRRREPHLRLSPEAKTLQGSGGCNTMRGVYQLDGERLRFTQIATTRMACPDPYMSQENAFLKVLEATDSFKLTDDKLELLGDGNLLARFEARQWNSELGSHSRLRFHRR
ncbi:MAG TPA: META domain-containing protein [Blastocatellia bacterium]|nr:META domain-containing protein [Blastocatellia bacterium]